MSRKLRFLKDQTHKAGLVLSPHAASEPDIELEELEVCIFYSSCIIVLCPGFYYYYPSTHVSHYHHLFTINVHAIAITALFVLLTAC